MASRTDDCLPSAVVSSCDEEFAPMRSGGSGLNLIAKKAAKKARQPLIARMRRAPFPLSVPPSFSPQIARAPKEHRPEATVAVVCTR
mmetsp:Transcript_8159/g.15926  ORF Transcript_8159/g.15926 Transcript_8159/m.15926 type:complete len:87 (+) Transcript_8159:1005-1265(+)